MNDIYKCFPHALIVASLQICLAMTVSSCDRDSTVEEECTEAGETAPCDDEAGNPGSKLCLPEGVYTECLYLIPIAGQPCSDLGEEYACACDGRLTGNMYCLKDGTYSECFCDSASSSPAASAGSGGQNSASGGGDGCPPPFSCYGMEMEPGGPVNNLCVEGGIPPICESNPDCDAEGLEEGQCLDIGVGTKVCIQACN
jgi:hypothetical protein